MKKRLTIVMAVACCLALMVGTMAFFTDRADATASGTAGNIDLVFTDASVKNSGHESAGQTNTDDNVWTDSKITNDTNPMMNPGDNFDMGYKLSNTGNKSIDIRQQITVTVKDKSGNAMVLTESATEGAGDYQYFMQAADALGLTLITNENKADNTTFDVSDPDNGVLVYKLSDVTLNGFGEKAETEDGVSVTEQDFDVYLTFERLAKNVFMDSQVTVDLDIQAKQHRNTTDTDWIAFATYNVESNGVTPVEQIDNTNA